MWLRFAIANLWLRFVIAICDCELVWLRLWLWLRLVWYSLNLEKVQIAKKRKEVQYCIASKSNKRKEEQYCKDSIWERASMRFVDHHHNEVCYSRYSCDLSTTSMLQWGCVTCAIRVICQPYQHVTMRCATWIYVRFVYVRFVNRQHVSMRCATCAIRAICHLPRTWLYDFYTVRFECFVINFILLMNIHLKVSWLLGSARIRESMEWKTRTAQSKWFV